MKQNTCDNKNQPDSMQIKIERALKRAAEEARRVARFYGTPIYVHDEKSGKIVALKP